MAIAITEQNLYFNHGKSYLLLTADIGGTRTRYRVSDLSGNEVASGKLKTNDYDNATSLTEIMLSANDNYKRT